MSSYNKFITQFDILSKNDKMHDKQTFPRKGFARKNIARTTAAKRPRDRRG